MGRERVIGLNQGFTLKVPNTRPITIHQPSLPKYKSSPHKFYVYYHSVLIPLIVLNFIVFFGTIVTVFLTACDCIAVVVLGYSELCVVCVCPGKLNVCPCSQVAVCPRKLCSRLNMVRFMAFGRCPNCRDAAPVAFKRGLVM